MGQKMGVHDEDKLSRAAARMRTVLDFKWQNPFMSWSAICEATKTPRRTVTRWRAESELWESLSRETAVRHVTDLAPAATHALLTSWKAGRAEHEAVELLRSLALLAPQTSNVNIHEADAGEIRDRLIRRILGQRHPEDDETG